MLWKRRAEGIVSIILIIIGVYSVITFLTHRPDYMQQSSASVHKDQVISLAKMDLSNNDRTLLVAMRVGCVYCERNVPSYRRLATLLKEGKLNAKILVVMPDPQRIARAALGVYQLDLPLRAEMQLDQLKIASVPTILLVDPDGTVVRAWVGQLDKKSEEELISSVMRHG